MTVAELPGGSDPALTARQREVLQVIRESVDQRGYPPSLREIAAATGLASLSSVSHHLRVLEAKEYVERVAGQPRSAVVRPLQQQPASLADTEPPDSGPQRAVEVPLLGHIAAGKPILAAEAVEDVFCLPPQLVGHGEFFMLRVKGDSMVNAGIVEGDLVVVRTRSDIENGDIVAAKFAEVEEEATVKTLKRSGGKVWLMPHNPAYEPIDGDNAAILGKVVAVLRRV